MNEILSQVQNTKLWQVFKSLAIQGGASSTKWVFLRTAEVVSVAFLALVASVARQIWLGHWPDLQTWAGITGLASMLFGFAAKAQNHKAVLDSQSATGKPAVVEEGVLSSKTIVGLLFVALMLLPGMAHGQTMTDVATTLPCIADGSGSVMQSGKFSIRATDGNDNPVPFRAGGSGAIQAVNEEVTRAIVNGQLASLRVGDGLAGSPRIVYRVVITNNKTKQVTTYRKVPVTGATFNWCDYNPAQNLQFVSTTTVAGPKGDKGDPGCVVGSTGCQVFDYVDVCATAACDGTTDDTGAVQALVSSSSYLRVQFPAGKTVYMGPVDVSTAHTIRVDGMVKLKSGTYSSLAGLFQVTGVSNVTITGEGTLDGNGQSANVAVVYGHGATNLNTSNFKVINAGEGIRCYACTNFKAKGHTLTSTHANAIKCESYDGASRGCDIEDNTIEITATQNGIFVWGDTGYAMSDVKVCGNKIHNAGDIGIEISRANSVTLCNNRVLADTPGSSTAYYFRGTTGLTSSGNYGNGTNNGWVAQQVTGSDSDPQPADITSSADVMEHVSGKGFMADKSLNVTITGATSQYNGTGFFVTQSKGVKIFGGTAHHNQMDGISAEDTDYLQIDGGMYYDNVQVGTTGDLSAIRFAKNTGNGVRYSSIKNTTLWDDQTTKTQNYCAAFEGTDSVTMEGNYCPSSKSGLVTYSTGDTANPNLSTTNNPQTISQRAKQGSVSQGSLSMDATGAGSGFDFPGGSDPAVGISVPIATVGDFVLVSSSQPLIGVQAQGYVSQNGIVKIRIQNYTAGALVYPAATWKVQVIKTPFFQ
ncbi:hypothetical protein [Terriglobus albidus]|uniref:hypothetical protein n=1 Tax=Terriglobus albidus TaxID=1592106 RepID=UPI0021E00D1E|nr:hypothetical protein [Terriglobus albidus]